VQHQRTPSPGQRRAAYPAGDTPPGRRASRKARYPVQQTAGWQTHPVPGWQLRQSPGHRHPPQEAKYPPPGLPSHRCRTGWALPPGWRESTGRSRVHPAGQDPPRRNQSPARHPPAPATVPAAPGCRCSRWAPSAGREWLPAAGSAQHTRRIPGAGGRCLPAHPAGRESGGHGAPRDRKNT